MTNMCGLPGVVEVPSAGWKTPIYSMYFGCMKTGVLVVCCVEMVEVTPLLREWSVLWRWPSARHRALPLLYGEAGKTSTFELCGNLWGGRRCSWALGLLTESLQCSFRVHDINRKMSALCGVVVEIVQTDGGLVSLVVYSWRPLLQVSSFGRGWGAYIAPRVTLRRVVI